MSPDSDPAPSPAAAAPPPTQARAIAFPTVTQKDKLAARALWVELVTRITTQRLHYRSGDEETAAASIRSIFDTVRKLLTDRDPGEAFDLASTFMLNRVIRAYTARWHKWMVDGRFDGTLVRRRFRKELSELRRRLEPFQELFLTLSRVEQPESALIEKCFGKLSGDGRIAFEEASGSGLADMGDPLVASIGPQVKPFQPEHNANFVDTTEIDRLEHRAIRARRRAMRRDSTTGHPLPSSGGEPPKNPAEGKPEPVLDAAGLCLSGGGIRSATFCLGIVQVLAERGMLAQFDYLSTVSGGGYLGTFLSSYLGTRSAPLRQALAAQDVFNFSRPPSVGKAGEATPTPEEVGDDPAARIKATFAPHVGGDESDAVRHLRNNSRYLLNGGLWARLQIVGLLVSGVIANAFVLLPLPLAAVLIVLGLERAGYWDEPHALQGSAAPWCHAQLRLPWDTCAAGVLLISGLVLAACWLILPVVQNLTRRAPPKSLGAKSRALWQTLTLVLALLTAGAAALFFLPVIVCGYSRLRGLLPSPHAIPLTEKTLGVLTAAGTFLLGPFAARLRSSSWTKTIVSGLFAISGPGLLIFLFLFAGSRVLLPDELVWCWPYLAGITGGLLAWSWLGLNINLHGMRGFYRDRLCECYLATRDKALDHQGVLRRLLRWFLHGKSPGERGVGTLQRLPLSALGSDPAAPYHLINTTVNLPASADPNLRGRDSDFFVFSRHVCGSPICGYVRTETIEQLDPQFDLGTAMAVSGAAVSSNMGTLKTRDFRFLLTLTNLRLGYWLRNPRWPYWPPQWLTSLVGAPGPAYLFAEIIGWMHERARYLNLSDGGHIENLALYELLRRRCKYIVVVDAGHEPGMEAADLMLVQRYAAIDLGIEMEFDLSDLMLDAKRASRAYAVLGKIFYDPANRQESELGWLVYIKLAMVGGEPGYVTSYRRQNPDFPHQSTGEQIYEEAQFEAYRALGEAAAKSLFDEELTESFRNAVAARTNVAADDVILERIDDWFQAMATSLLPDNDLVFHPGGNRGPDHLLTPRQKP